MPSVYPLTLYAPDQIAHYPHMARRDAEVWERFLRKRGAEFTAFSYDVALGGRVLDLAGGDPDTIRAWQYSTALKIDAVGWMGNQAWIIEVRPEATVGTYGAAVAYTLVFRREQITELPLVPTIVCNAIQLDVLWVCQQTGVQVVQVPP